MNPGTGKLKSRLVASTILVSALLAGLAHSSAQQTPQGQMPGGSPRLALVIGEASYKSGPLASAANDAGLIADTLQLAGFDVTGAADLDQDGLRKSLREFVDKASAAGPDATVFLYLGGRALQYEGENYFAPIEATIARPANAPLEAVRLSDYLQPLEQLPLKSRIIVLDAARINNFAPGPQGFAGGLALVEPSNGELIAYNAAPDTVAPDDAAPYGVYAQALNEMLREGGLPVDEAFARARLRVSEVTKGAQVPWDESQTFARSRALRPRPGRAAARRGARDASQYAGAANPRLSCRPGLRRSAGAGHDLRLFRFPQRLSQLRLRQQGARHARRATRGADLAARLASQYAERLLDLSAALSARTTRRGRPAAPRHAERRAHAAAAIRRVRI